MDAQNRRSITGLYPPGAQTLYTRHPTDRGWWARQACRRRLYWRRPAVRSRRGACCRLEVYAQGLWCSCGCQHGDSCAAAIRVERHVVRERFSRADGLDCPPRSTRESSVLTVPAPTSPTNSRRRPHRKRSIRRRRKPREVVDGIDGHGPPTGTGWPTDPLARSKGAAVNVPSRTKTR
jgi:hypothetical protein